MSEKEKIGLSKDDLLEILKEVKRPVKTDEQIRAEEQAKRDAEALAESMREVERQKKADQDACLHARRNGSTPAVYVSDPLGGYFLCQHCRKIVRPNEEPDLFNKLMQLSREDQ
jgi:hypothetical protein